MNCIIHDLLLFLVISNILHANRKFRKIKMGTTMLGASTMGNSMMKPGSFIQSFRKSPRPDQESYLKKPCGILTGIKLKINRLSIASITFVNKPRSAIYGRPLSMSTVYRAEHGQYKSIRLWWVKKLASSSL